MDKQPCKTCEAKGLMLKKEFAVRHIGTGNLLAADHITFVSEACDCCGGWADHCENCEAGYRKINWGNTQDYETAITNWLEGTVLDLMREDLPLDYYTVYSDDGVIGTERIDDMYNFIKSMSFQEKQSIRKDIAKLIPGNHKKDVVVLARRTRLIMVQLLYDKGHLTLEEARKQLNNRLSPDKPETYFDDSKLLYKKENDDGNESKETG